MTPRRLRGEARRWLAGAPGAALTIVALSAAALSCAGSGSSQAGKPVVRLAENPWSGSRVDAAVAAVLLHEELGYPVEIAAVDEYA